MNSLWVAGKTSLSSIGFDLESNHLVTIFHFTNFAPLATCVWTFPQPLSAKMNRGLLILLYFKGIPGVLRQATEKPVLFQDFWAWMFQAPVMPMKLEMTLVPEAAFYLHQMRWQGMWGLMVGSPQKRSSFRNWTYMPSFVLACRAPSLSPTSHSMSWSIPTAAKLVLSLLGLALALPQIFPFKVHSLFKKFFSAFLQGWINLSKTLHRQR